MTLKKITKMRVLCAAVLLGFLAQIAFIAFAPQVSFAQAIDKQAGPATVSNDDITSAASSYCSGDTVKRVSAPRAGIISKQPVAACIAGYVSGVKQSPAKDTVCNEFDNRTNNKNTDRNRCKAAYDKGKSDGPQVRNTATADEISGYASDYCKGDVVSRVTERMRTGEITISVQPTAACITGFLAGFNQRPNKDEACDQFNNRSDHDKSDRNRCKTAYDKGKVKGESARADAFETPPTDVNPAGTGSVDDEANTQQNANCQSTWYNPLTWVLCAVYDGMAGFSDFLLTTFLQPLLRTDPIPTSTCQDGGSECTDANQCPKGNNSDQCKKNVVYVIWSNFRIYGNIFLVMVLLIMVFGQSIGVGIFDAYTVKKTLPRILIAGILINLSIYFVALMVDITNVVGQGINSIMTAPLADQGMFNIRLSAGDSVGVAAGATVAGLGAAVFFGTGAAAAAAPFIAVFVLLPAVIALFITFVVIILRQAIILALVLVSPVAFALWCLPNTEQYFRKWWDLLIDWLVLYPLIMVIFAICDILAVAAAAAG